MSLPLILSLDEKVYSMGVAQRVVYSLAREYSIEVGYQDARLTLSIVPTTACISAGHTPETIRQRVLRELNDFLLRERIQRETAGMRELLVRSALAGCSR